MAANTEHSHHRCKPREMAFYKQANRTANEYAGLQGINLQNAYSCGLQPCF